MNKDRPAGEYSVEKESLSKELHQGGSTIARYKRKVLGPGRSFLRLLQFEFVQLCCIGLGGGLGYFLRRLGLSSLFQRCGKGTILGRGIILRIPGNISLGDGIAIDDQTLLDGGTGDNCRLSIGDRVIISKACVIQAKTGPIIIEENCDIGAHVILSSISGITLAANVLIAGNCYIGGARYHLESLQQPIMYQGTYSRGPIFVGQGSWIGASVTILDGVRIGKGCVIGAGAVVTRNIPDFAIAVGNPAKVVKTRD